MRSASASLLNHLAGEVTTLCRLWKVTRTDSVVYYFTDSVRDIVYNGHTYKANPSFTSSAVLTSKTFANAQSMTMTVVMDAAGISETDLRLRKFDSADSELVIIDYEHPEYGALGIFSGKFGRIKISEKLRAEIEVRPNSSSLNGRLIGADKYSQTCRASLGDSKCTIDLSTRKAAFTVASASGGSIVAAAFTQASGAWTLGFIKWLTGANAGTTQIVQSNDQASTSVFLASTPPLTVSPGDTGEIYPGCDKLIKTCRDKFNNVLNFRGEPTVPDNAYTPPSYNGPPVVGGNYGPDGYGWTGSGVA